MIISVNHSQADVTQKKTSTQPGLRVARTVTLQNPNYHRLLRAYDIIGSCIRKALSKDTFYLKIKKVSNSKRRNSFFPFCFEAGFLGFSRWRTPRNSPLFPNSAFKRNLECKFLDFFVVFLFTLPIRNSETISKFRIRNCSELPHFTLLHFTARTPSDSCFQSSTSLQIPNPTVSVN